MEFKKEIRALSKVDADVLIIAIFQDEQIKDALLSLDGEFDQSLVDQIVEESVASNFKGKPGQTLHLPTGGKIAAKHVLVRGLGKRNQHSVQAVRKVTPTPVTLIVILLIVIVVRNERTSAIATTATHNSSPNDVLVIVVVVLVVVVVDIVPIVDIIDWCD